MGATLLCRLIVPPFHPTLQPTTELLEQHYADLASKGFFAGLIKYMSSGPVVCMVRARHTFPLYGPLP
jgi:hypothetical protein